VEYCSRGILLTLSNLSVYYEGMGVKHNMETKLRTTLDLPDYLVDEYESQRGDTPLEDFLITRLTECVDHYGDRPLFFSDSQVKELESLTGGFICTTSQKALDRLRSCQTIRIVSPDEEPVDIQLSSSLLTRLKSRCFGRTFPEAITEETIIGLEQYAQMR
jgi:hypothetical protein